MRHNPRTNEGMNDSLILLCLHVDNVCILRSIVIHRLLHTSTTQISLTPSFYVPIYIHSMEEQESVSDESSRDHRLMDDMDDRYDQHQREPP